MFEMIWIISNVFFLISNVVFHFCGRFFVMCGNAFSKIGKSELVSGAKVMPAVPGIEDFYKWKSFSVMGEK